MHMRQGQTETDLMALKAEMNARVAQIENDHGALREDLQSLKALMANTREFIVEQFAVIRTKLNISEETKNKSSIDHHE